MKDLEWIGSSLSDLKSFPEPAMRRAGYQIRKVQSGFNPDDWKPMTTIGNGVREIRISEGGAFRVIYTASIGDVVYVLHAFHKKTQETRKSDIKLARKRLKEVLSDERK